MVRSISWDEMWSRDLLRRLLPSKKKAPKKIPRAPQSRPRDIKEAPKNTHELPRICFPKV